MKLTPTNESLGHGGKPAIWLLSAAALFGCANFAVASETTTSGPSAWQAFFEDKVSFSGRLHPQFDYLESDLENTEVADPGVAKRDFLRRAFAGVKVEVSDTLRVNYLTDLSDWEVKNQIARLEWSPNDAHRFHFGYEKVPFGYEDTTSSSKVKPIERSASTRFWNEVVGIGSYHSGVYYTRRMPEGLESTFAVTHNVKSESDWPDVFSGDVSAYLRVMKKGKFASGSPFLAGLDLGYQPYGDGREIYGLSAFSAFEWSGYEFALEATTGRIDLLSGSSANPFSWHGQVSRMMGEKFEWVARLSQVDTDGYALKLSSAIRKAPASGFTYEAIESLYLGINCYVKGNDLKLSLGYELAEGRDALSGPGSLGGVEENVSGFRVRGQLMF